MTPSKSNCSRFGHKLAMFSKSRSVRPRIAARKSFFSFVQPFNNSFRLSPGDASSRRLKEKLKSVFDCLILMMIRVEHKLTTSQNQPLPVPSMWRGQVAQLPKAHATSTCRSIRFSYCTVKSLATHRPY